MRRTSFLFGLAAALLVVPGIVRAAPGQLDPTFSGDGKTLTRIGDSGGAIAVAPAPHGKLVVLGNTYRRITLARFRRDGRLDRGLSGDGVRTLNLLHVTGQLQATSVAVGPNGKILVVAPSYGRPTERSIIARLVPDGTFDRSFGGDGRVRLARYVSQIVVQEDGKILGTEPRAIVRLRKDGSRDPSFGENGLARLDFSPTSIAPLPSGRFAVVGADTSNCGEGGCDVSFTVARLLPDGELDPSFGGDGETGALPYLNDTEDGTVVAAPGGKIVAAANAGSASIVRFNPDGSLDRTFSSDGTFSSKRYAFAEDPFDMAHVAVQHDGKVVAVIPEPWGSGTWRFRLMRLTPGGSLDRSFGGDGLVVTKFAGKDRGLSMAIVALPRARIAAVGWIPDVPGLAVARYLAR